MIIGGQLYRFISLGYFFGRVLVSFSHSPTTKQLGPHPWNFFKLWYNVFLNRSPFTRSCGPRFY